MRASIAPAALERGERSRADIARPAWASISWLVRYSPARDTSSLVSRGLGFAGFRPRENLVLRALDAPKPPTATVAHRRDPRLAARAAHTGDGRCCDAVRPDSPRAAPPSRRHAGEKVTAGSGLCPDGDAGLEASRAGSLSTEDGLYRLAVLRD